MEALPRNSLYGDAMCLIMRYRETLVLRSSTAYRNLGTAVQMRKLGCRSRNSSVAPLLVCATTALMPTYATAKPYSCHPLDPNDVG